jgi:hypothetical protein
VLWSVVQLIWIYKEFLSILDFFEEFIYKKFKETLILILIFFLKNLKKESTVFMKESVHTVSL